MKNKNALLKIILVLIPIVYIKNTNSSNLNAQLTKNSSLITKEDLTEIRKKIDVIQRKQDRNIWIVCGGITGLIGGTILNKYFKIF